MCLLRRAGFRAAVLVVVALSTASAAAGEEYPHVPEPMVFDMMRPLGAKRGELEANVLATTRLSGEDRAIHWAPEVEYAFADGFAIEGELPFENGRLAELKLGLQAAFGTLNQGRSAHGVQYLGIYDRHDGRYSNSLIYMLAHRFDGRWSNVAMAGVSDIGGRKHQGGNALILNNSTFYNASQETVLGVELNWLGSREGQILVMPQVHQRLGGVANVQFGLGAQKLRGEPARPHAGVRVIREF